MIEKDIKHLQLKAEEVITNTVATFEAQTVSSRLISAIKYSLLNGGKRIRAALLYAVGQALGAEEKALDQAAVAIEMIHAYSLIHDDLPAMDDDDLRRGKPTSHVAYDEATAILAGDALQAMAYECLSHPNDLNYVSPEQQIKVINILSRCSGVNGMVAGQMLDMQAENSHVTVEQLKNIHQHKTGDLLAACVLMAFYLSKHYQNKAIEQALSDFAFHIGLAFQIQDDILDVTASTEQLGKMANHDISQNKLTFPALLGLAESKQLMKENYDKSIQALDAIDINSTTIKAIAEYIIYRKS